MPLSTDLLVYHSSQPIKLLEEDGDLKTVGGLAVVFDDPEAPKKDLTGEYFTAKTYLGAQKGNGADVLFHHGLPIAGTTKARELADYLFPAAKTEEDELGLLSSVVLDMRKEYERFAFEKAMAGELGWSTASAGHMVRKAVDGFIKRWPIIEISMTPTPAEPRTSAVPVKSLLTTSATKAESLNERIGRFHDAFRERFDDAWVEEVFDQDGYVIAYGDGQYFRVPFTIEDGEISYAGPTRWTEVERDVVWEAKALLQMKLMNLNRQLRQRGSHA